MRIAGQHPGAKTFGLSRSGAVRPKIFAPIRPQRDQSRTIVLPAPFRPFVSSRCPRSDHHSPFLPRPSKIRLRNKVTNLKPTRIEQPGRSSHGFTTGRRSLLRVGLNQRGNMFAVRSDDQMETIEMAVAPSPSRALTLFFRRLGTSRLFCLRRFALTCVRKQDHE